MFASQLLRILQTIPSDVKRESCVYDSAEQDMTMKENETHYESQSLQREAVPLAFGNKEIYIRETNPPLFDSNGSRDELFVDEFPIDNQNGTRDSTAEEFPVRPLCRLSSLDEDEDSLCSDTNGTDKDPMRDQTGTSDSAETEFRNRPVCRPSSFEEEDADSLSSWTNATEKEHEFPTEVEEFMHGNESEYSAVDLFQTDTKLYEDDDKKELEYDRPEIIVCYKEINYHVVEDICIGGDSFPQPLDNNDADDDADTDSDCQVAEGAPDMELFPSDELTTSSSNSSKGIYPDEDASKEENSFDSMKKGETKTGASGETSNDSSKKDSFIDKTLPIQEFGTRSFLRSFINSFDGEDNINNNNNNKVEHWQDQEITSAESRPKEDVQAKSLTFKSKVESRSITFNFKSPPPAPAGATKQITDNVEEQSIVDLDDKDANADNLIGEIEEQPLETNNVFSNDLSSTSKKDKFEMQIRPEIEISPKTLQSIAKESDDASSSGKSVNSVNNEIFVADSNFLKRDEGETSFSAGGLITFSGAVAYSGSISHRSDGSATSGRSFAFPVLQGEWNSSPERIPKDGDGRHFRKHKGWRSGLLCCRF